MYWRIWFKDGTFEDVVRGMDEREIWVEFCDVVRVECFGIKDNE